MAKKLIEEPNPTQFERTYKDEDCTMVWKYDTNKFQNGPVSVEIKWTAEYLKENKSGRKSKPEGKLGELHDAFAKLDAKRKKKKPSTPKKRDDNYW